MNSDKLWSNILEEERPVGARSVDASRTMNQLTEKVIGCAYTVGNTLGCGFLEKVYENALTIELRKSGLNAEQQVRMSVLYEGIEVGDYCADIIVEGVLILEIKALAALSDTHKAQILNYLKATNLKLGLLINFGRPKVEIKRAVL